MRAKVFNNEGGRRITTNVVKQDDKHITLEAICKSYVFDEWITSPIWVTRYTAKEKARRRKEIKGEYERQVTASYRKTFTIKQYDADWWGVWGHMELMVKDEFSRGQALRNKTCT